MTEPRFPAPTLSDPDATLPAPAGTPLAELAETAEPESSGRRLPGHRSRILLEIDGQIVEHVVRIDNRDYLRWDKTAPRNKWGSAQDVPFLLASFTSWSAANRASVFPGTFDAFSHACLEVSEVRDEQEEDTARPTR